MFIIYIIIGIASGALGAMGIGGGSISILILSGFLGVEQKNSQLINLFAFIIPAITAIIIHAKHKLININQVIFTIVGGIPTAICGVLIATQLQPSVLKHIFGIFLLLLGVFEIFHKMLYNIINKFKQKKLSSSQQ